MIEVRDLLGPGATLSAVTLAVFVFAFSRSLAIFNEKRAALLEADVPDPVKKQKLFIFFVFGDSILMFMISFLSLVIGILFVIVLYQSLQLYLGSPLFTVDKILGDFSYLLLMLVIILAFFLVASLALFATEAIIGEKKLPLLARVYARSVLGRRSSNAEAGSLVPEARFLYEKEAFGESVLYSVASLELALRNKLDLPEGVGFRRLLGSVREKLGEVIVADELIKIRNIRNIAAHPSPERKVTKKDAEQVLHLVGKILQRLQGDYYVILIQDAQEQMDKLQRRYYNLVNKTISTLGQEPKPQRSKKLVEEGLWVIRVGQYRVIYSIDDEKRQVVVRRITKRTEDTYKRL